MPIETPPESGPENNSEKLPIQREVVVSALQEMKRSGEVNDVTIELLNKWNDQQESLFEHLTDRAEVCRARNERDLENAELYYEAGFLEQAYDNLLESYENQNDDHVPEDLNEKIRNLMQKIWDELHASEDMKLKEENDEAIQSEQITHEKLIEEKRQEILDLMKKKEGGDTDTPKE